MRPAAALVYLASVARVAAIEYKPAAQRGVQNSRGFVPSEAERIQAHRPELESGLVH